MAIPMQGAWTVSVKQKSAAFPQRFIVSGATSGNGTYAGDPATAPVFVTGDHWSITLQNNPGSGWIDSQDQIKFPTVSSGQYRFDIEGNDAGADLDFNDLVLTCSTPVTATDFIVYGHVSYYGSGCIFNPCFRLLPVIDSVVGLSEALKNRALADAIKKLYPERVRVPVPRNPGDPPPPPFRPLMLPLTDDGGLPPKQALDLARVSGAKTASAEAANLETTNAPLAARSLASASIAALSKLTAAERLGIASIVDRVIRLCDTGPLPGVVLRVNEYDRTSAELLGGPYTGTGHREILGVAATDRNGNYIFRFTRSIADFLDEAANDTALGENALTASAPDLIVELLDAMAPGGVAYESALHSNVAQLRRINLCIPESAVGRRPTACQGGHAIQAIGNIFIGAPTQAPPPGQPTGYGARVGFSNFLGLTGRITAKNVLGPQTRCAAWGGTLDLFACFLDRPNVKRYTIRYRRLGTSAYSFFSQEYRHPKIAKIGVPGYSGDVVGPHVAPLHVDGGPAVAVPSYDNIESDPAFVFTHRDRKAQIRTVQLSVAMPGSVQFLIEGYDAAGNRVAGAEDSVTLYVDNNAVFLDIDANVTLGSESLGNCALFHLPAGSPAAPLSVSFKADQERGFLQSYELYVNKGATGAFSVAPPPPAGAPFRLRSYVHGDDLACSSLRGTFDDPTVDPTSGYVTVSLAPAAGAWLEPGQAFCAFSLNLTAATRVTNGYGGFGPYHAVPVLIGIQAA